MSQFKPSYRFKLARADRKVVLTPSVRDDKGDIKPIGTIELSDGKIFTPSSELQQNYLINHDWLKGGSLIAIRIADEPKSSWPELDKPAILQERDVAGAPDAGAPEVTEELFTNFEQEDSNSKTEHDEIIAQSLDNRRKAIIESVTSIQDAAKALRELGIQHNIRSKREMIPFAKEHGIVFPNWK